MTFRINLKSTVFVAVPTFSAEQLQGFGESAIEVMKRRILLGVNVSDQPAKPLKASRRTWDPRIRRYVDYADYKSSIGRNPIRDLFLTGAMLNSLRVTSVGDHGVRIGFPASQMVKAHANQEREPMFGLSPADQRQIFAEMLTAWRIGLEAALMVVSGAIALNRMNHQIVSGAQIIQMPAPQYRYEFARAA